MDSPRSPSPRPRYSWLLGLLLSLLVYMGVSMLLPDPKQAGIRHGHASFLLNSIRTALRVYADEHQGEYPAALDALLVPRADGSSYFGNHPQTLLDSWNRAYLYAPPTPWHPEPRVWSLGADGKQGGEGEDADLDSTELAGSR